MQKIKQFIKTHPHMWWGLYMPVYLIMYFTVEHVVTDNYWATQTAIDNYIPFCEYFVIPYNSWSILLFVLGVFFIVKDPESFRRYMWFIAIAYTTATLFCFLVPNGQDLRPAVLPRHNICTWLLQMTWAADNNANVFPSVHVLGVVAAIAAMWHSPKLKRYLAGPGYRMVCHHCSVYAAGEAACLHRPGGRFCLGRCGVYHRVCYHRP